MADSTNYKLRKAYIYSQIRHILNMYDKLTLVDGDTYESITDRLQANSINYRILRQPKPKDRFFKDSILEVLASGDPSPFKFLGLGHRAQFGTLYYGRWKPDPDFDWSSVGPQPKDRMYSLTFQSGLLLERIRVHFTDREFKN